MERKTSRMLELTPSQHKLLCDVLEHVTYVEPVDARFDHEVRNLLAIARAAKLVSCTLDRSELTSPVLLPASSPSSAAPNGSFDTTEPIPPTPSDGSTMLVIASDAASPPETPPSPTAARCVAAELSTALTIRDFAARIKKSRRTAQRVAITLPHLRIGRRLFVPESSVRAYFDSCRRGPAMGDRFLDAARAAGRFEYP